MLSETSREAFLDLIRPPTNFKLKYCIGTTFSLELPCLVQLALNSQGKKEELENLSIYEGFEIINEFSSKACVFTQNCRIKSLPSEITSGRASKKGRFISLLDGMVEEVPISGPYSAFHPKVWFIRFDNEKSTEEPVFKLFVMSRNLTSSLKWDISSCLVGKFGEPSSNIEIVKFLKSLERKSSLRGRNNKILDMAIDDLGRVTFELPNMRTFKKYEFLFKWGLEKKWEPINYRKYQKLIIVSPFLSRGQLKQLDQHPNCILVTSKDDLKKVEEFKSLKKATYVMDSHDMDLHAKMYLGLHEGGADVYIGSANCTDSAWTKNNVEANILFSCAKKVFEDFRGNFIFDGEGRPYDWLKTFDYAFTPSGEDISEEEAIQNKLDLAQGLLSTGEFVLDYKKHECKVSYQGKDVNLPSGVTGSLCIVGVSGKSDLKKILKLGVKFVDVRPSDISSFIVIELCCRNVKREFCTVAISNINRSQRNKSILSETIKDWNSFWEYLGVLLDFDGQNTSNRNSLKRGNSSSFESKSERGSVKWRYLEPLLLAGASEPGLIKKIETAIRVLEEKDSNIKHADYKKFKGFWEQYKAASKEFMRYG
jgi:hypothetical protein